MKIRQHRYYPGYSLIEILIVIAIMGTLIGVGYSSVRDFSRRQQLLDAAKSVQGDLRLTQQLALSALKPLDTVNCNGVNTVNGYLFNILTANPAQYEIRASCGGVQASSAYKTISLPANIIITTLPAPNPILFKVLGDGTNIPTATTTIVLKQNVTNLTQTITISSGGQIQ